MERCKDERFFDLLYLLKRWKGSRVINIHNTTVYLCYPIYDSWRSSYKVKVKLPFKPLLDYLHVKEAQETTPETESEGYGDLRLVCKGRIVEAEFLHSIAQVFILVCIHRIKPGEDHRLDYLEAWKRFFGRICSICDGITYPCILYLPYPSYNDPHLSYGKGVNKLDLWGKDTELQDIVRLVSSNKPYLLPFFYFAVKDPDKDNSPLKRIIPGIKQQGLQWRIRVSFRRRNLLYNCLKYLLYPYTLFCTGSDGIGGINSDHILYLFPDPLRVGCRKVYLVQDRKY